MAGIKSSKVSASSLIVPFMLLAVGCLVLSVSFMVAEAALDDDVSARAHEASDKASAKANEAKDALQTKGGSKICVGKVCDDPTIFHYYECCGQFMNECCSRLQTWLWVVLVIIGVLLVSCCCVGIVRGLARR